MKQRQRAMRIDTGRLIEIITHQPPRRTAALPLGAAVRPRTQNYPKTLLLRHAAERRRIRAPFPVEYAFLALVEVPEHVAPDGVAPHSTKHLEQIL